MKDNHTIRAMRMSEVTACGQEFAENQMNIELRFAKTPSGISEISVRVYTQEDYFIGTDVRRNPDDGWRGGRNVRFTVTTDKEIDYGNYHIDVYCNGVPKWTATVHIGFDYEEWYRSTLKDIADFPARKFFAEKLCYNPCWKFVKAAKLSAQTTASLICRLHQFAADGMADDAGALPPLLLWGETFQCRALASFVLGMYIARKESNRAIYLKLKELVAGHETWDGVLQKLPDYRVTIIEVTDMTYSAKAVNMISMLLSLAKNKAFTNHTFIFYGTEENIENLRKECPTLPDVFTEYNTLHVMPKTDSYTNTEDAWKDEALNNLLPTDNVAETSTPAERELQQMIGLKRLKEEVQEAKLLALFNKQRRKLNLDVSQENRNHMLFLGNPGTGKTTVARLIGQLYHSMGLLSKGHTVETNRTHLVGQYIGQTETIVKKILEEARGGVLFIDEAYTLMDGFEENSKDYGRDVINALLTVLSEPDPDMIIILAGYEEKMKRLLQMNPGLQDRFVLHCHFDDFSAGELMEMAAQLLTQHNYRLTPEAEEKLNALITETVKCRDEHFGNGRWVHNLVIHGILKNMARRVMSTPQRVADRRLFTTVEAEDIIRTGETLLKNRCVKADIHPRIGFRA